MIILVDALDESLTYSGQKKIVEILAGLSDIPKKVRFIITTRPDPSVVVHFQNIKPFDLVKDAPSTVDDIYLYVLERMKQIFAAQQDNAKIDPFYIGKLATKISKAAKGIFLYAHLLFGSILRKLPNVPEFIESGLPEGLGGLYNTFLNREIGTNEEKWYKDFKPLLGLIPVSQGKGLTKNQLNNIIGHDIEYSLSIWKEYLDGPFPDGPFHIFHKSFSDFLLEDRKDNINRRISAQEMHKKIIDYYWPIVETHATTDRNQRSIHEEWRLVAERDGIDKRNPYFYALYHLAAYITDWNQEISPVIYDAVFQTTDDRDLSDMWSSWTSEISADFWALRQANFASVVGLSEVVANVPSSVFRIIPGDPHPMGFLRVILGLTACKEMFGKGRWDDFASTWKVLYPLSKASNEAAQIVNDSLPALESLCKNISNTKMQAFSGMSLNDLLPFRDRSPHKIRALLNQDATDFNNPSRILELDPITILTSFRIIQLFGGRTQHCIRNQMGNWLASLASINIQQ